MAHCVAKQCQHTFFLSPSTQLYWDYLVGETQWNTISSLHWPSTVEKGILQHSMGKDPKLIEENGKLEPPQIENMISVLPDPHHRDERKPQQSCIKQPVKYRHMHLTEFATWCLVLGVVFIPQLNSTSQIVCMRLYIWKAVSICCWKKLSTKHQIS